MPASRGQFKMVLDAESEAVLDLLSRRLGISRAAVMRQALRRFARAEGIEVPATAADDDLGGAAA